MEVRQMPRGDKDKYTDKQKRQAEHIEKGYEAKGLSESEAERRAWATVNAVHHGGEKPGGGGYGKAEDREPMRRGARAKTHDEDYGETLAEAVAVDSPAGAGSNAASTHFSISRQTSALPSDSACRAPATSISFFGPANARKISSA
jgi:hypothetical protein